MEFKLNDFHRNISNEELLDDMRNVANFLGVETLTMEVYVKNGRYHSSTIQRRFGGWNNALKEAGLDISHIEVSNSELLEDLYKTAKNIGQDTITVTQYVQLGKHSPQVIIRRFNTWETALLKAGLNPTGFRSSVTIQELLEEIERVWVQLGRQPTTTDIKNGVSKFSLNSYARKFGSWRKALETFVKYINSDDTKQEKELEQSNVISNCSGEQEQQATTRKTQRDINLRLRFLVMKRDNFKCCLCGRSPATTPGLELHIDHIKPWSMGGETTFDNLQTLCSDCNLGKSNLV